MITKQEYLDIYDVAGIAMEAEYFPNAVNYEGQKKPIVHAGETMKHRICFTLSRI